MAGTSARGITIFSLVPACQPSFAAMIKVGDLVNFKSGVRSWSVDYEHRSPGIVRWVRYGAVAPRGSASVYWKNGETTTEHLTYLELIGN